MNKVIAFFVLSVLLFSCKKAEDRACFKSAGSDATKEINLPSFNKMYLKEHLTYVLVQDTVEKIILKGGKNLLNLIDAQVDESGLLTIINGNKCRFLRSYSKKVTVEIHFKELINMEYVGSETLTNKGVINLGWFTLLVRDGAGPLKMNVDAEFILASVNHGWGDFTLAGNVNNLILSVRSNGYCDTYGLQVQDTITAISNTQGDMKINVDGAVLKAETDADGSIYYKGIPSVKSFNKYGAGDLIDAN